MPEHRILRLKPALRLEWRGKNETEQPDHSASLGDSVTSSTRIRFSVHTGKHVNTLIRALRKVYGQNFAASYPETEKLSKVRLQLNETSLSQLRRDHETGHLEHKIANASK